ncbi:MAG: hypothetical protein M3Y04_05160 [Actinomycetota bacterium]|nr:hypothetical protein [Actinomycetota bacterium]
MRREARLFTEADLLRLAGPARFARVPDSFCEHAVALGLWYLDDGDAPGN